MSLEDRVSRTNETYGIAFRAALVTATASTSLWLSILGYKNFAQELTKEAIVYTTLAIGIGLASVKLSLNLLNYILNPNKFINEETGSFGVPDSVIRNIERERERRESGRYRST